MILLDTHVLIWALAAPGKVGRRLSQKIQGEHATGFSPLSIFEARLLHLKGRLPKLPENLAFLANQIGIVELAYDASAAEAAGNYQDLMGTDPFDWMLVAQAQSAGCDFYTADLRLLGLGLPFIKDATL